MTNFNFNSPEMMMLYLLRRGVIVTYLLLLIVTKVEAYDLANVQLEWRKRSQCGNIFSGCSAAITWEKSAFFGKE